MTGDNVDFYNCGGGREVRQATGVQWAEATDVAKCPAGRRRPFHEGERGPRCQ